MKKVDILKILIVIYMIAVGAYFYKDLPEMMPIHWNFEGVADNFAAKERAILIFPILGIVIMTLFHFLPRLDPKKDNYPKFEKAWEAFQVSILGFFAYAYTLSIIATLNPQMNISRYMMIGIGVLFIILGNYMGKIRRNYFVGIKLPWTIENEDVWNKTHRLGGKAFMIAGALFIINSFLNLNPGFVFPVIIFFVLVVPIVYSYLEYKKISS